MTMSTVRKMNLPEDLTMVKAWWKGHGAIPAPDEFLPQGYVVGDGTVDMAAAFLYLDSTGKLAMTEYLTTNPRVAFSRHLIEDVRALIAHIEGVAKASGCTGIISMVAPGTGEDRLMRRLGYLPPDGPAHIMFCKRLKEET